MKRTFGLALLVACGCGQAGAGTQMGNTQAALVGSWMSQGSDVAPLLAAAPFNWTSISASFAADGTYDVSGVDSSNKTTKFTGTYVATASTVSGIYTITTNQVEPSTATAEGIYEIDTTVTPNRMKYEVVQTQPTNGLVPPTPDGGFGSTIYNGQKIATLIQLYSRQ